MKKLYGIIVFVSTLNLVFGLFDMAFNVTYRNLISSNINHLYTTRQKTMYKNSPRQKLYNPEFLKLERQAQERHEKRKARKMPNMEYIPEYDMVVPRAPAFRQADSDYIDEMVRRLSRRSTLKSNPRSCPKYHSDFYDYGHEEEDMDTPRTKKSKKEIKGIVDRLSRPIECCKRHPSPNLREEDYLPNIII